MAAGSLTGGYIVLYNIIMRVVCGIVDYDATGGEKGGRFLGKKGDVLQCVVCCKRVYWQWCGYKKFVWGVGEWRVSTGRELV